jgi:ketose-bisphosphate aldolase
MQSLREYLAAAEKSAVAIGHFNFSDLITLQAIFNAAKDLGVPVLAGASEGERAFMGVRQAAAMARSIRDEYGYPIFLNADHTHSLAKAEDAAKAGFDSIVFDRSELPFEKNVAETRQAVEAVKSINPAMLVEGELGYIGTSSEVLDRAPEGIGNLTTAAEAKQFIDATKVDIFSPAVGNMHGLLKSMLSGSVKKRLDIPRIREIKSATGAFLTLHGGSGTDDDDFRKAIAAGINEVHINTELRVAWRRGLESSLKAISDVAPYKVLPGALKEVQKVVSERLRLFNEAGLRKDLAS